MSELHVIFGTGPLGRYTAESLIEKGHEVRLINRSGKMEMKPEGAELVSGDAYNFLQTMQLVDGATSIYQCAQPAYHKWEKEFPNLQNAIIELANVSKSKLIVAENLYMYGKASAANMTEKTPYEPCSKKGKVRTEMTKVLFDAHANGFIRAASVRGSDFFGPWDPNNGERIFNAALNRKPINMLGKLDQPHSFTYVKDFGKALAIAGTKDKALGRAWHVPSGKAYTQQEIVEIIAKQLGYELKARTAGKFILNLIGIFNPIVKEVIEMLYQFEAPFIMDASAMEKEFGMTATPMEQRVLETLDWFKRYKKN
jgi:nucleoside-diphosphate-sugar epimerase